MPVNPCGGFNSYDIFFSTDSNGPFTLLDNVTDQSAQDYFHNNPAGETFYYFFQTNANCPGEPVLNSDTLNNESPEVSPIINVTVNGNTIEINWNASPSPEVTSYIIYRTTSIGSLPIDTIDGNLNQYLDLNADPTGQSESYFILAMDACGNTSVFDLPHFTVFIESEVNVCDQSISLNWNRYKNWLNGIEKQELWVSVNNGNYELAEELLPSDSTYLFTNTNDGDNYCFFIKAIEEQSGVESFSNIHCLTIDIVEPVRRLFLKNVSVNENNDVELTWLWNDDAEVAFVEFAEKPENGNFTIIQSFDPGAILQEEMSRTSMDADPTTGKQFYRVSSIDDCDSIKISNEVATIHLAGFPRNDQTNVINWTAFERPDANLEYYEVYRIVDGLTSFVETVDASTNIFTDAIDISNPAEANVCYFVLAYADLTLPDGQTTSIISQSNLICIEQLSDILVPNAFAPEGVNKEFKPVIVFGETVLYQMQIFDRWGKKIFETTNQDEGWTGKKGFSLFPSGVYMYRIRITQTNGRVVEKDGAVALIR